MSTTPTSYESSQKTPDGKWLVTTKTTITAAILPPQAPIIPVNAFNSGLLDNSPNWKGDWDSSTPSAGTGPDGKPIPGATGTSKYISADAGRNFNIAYVNKAGFRFHNSFGNNANVTNFCTDLYVKCDDWTQVLNLEIDMNQVLSDGRTVIMGIQAASGSGTWEYTTTPGGSSHWSKSNIPVKPSAWAANVWKHIRLFYSRTAAGIVNYIGVEVDGIYTPFEGATGVSAIPLGWKPLGLLLCNFQCEGTTAKGVINLYVKQYQHYYW